MKKNIIISLVIVVILIFLFTISTYSNQYDFRKTNWEMSKKQVKATEKGEIAFEDEEEINYKVEINRSEFLCAYFFLEDKLYRSGYLLNETHTNENDYIDDYKNLKDILIKKYERPVEDKIEWKNDSYKDDKIKWGLAISVGDLIYDTRWETNNTEITLRLSGDNYKIYLVLRYESKELKEWADKIIEERIKSSF